MKGKRQMQTLAGCGVNTFHFCCSEELDRASLQGPGRRVGEPSIDCFFR